MFTLLMLSKNPSLDKEDENFNVEEMFFCTNPLCHAVCIYNVINWQLHTFLQTQRINLQSIASRSNIQLELRQLSSGTLDK